MGSTKTRGRATRPVACSGDAGHRRVAACGGQARRCWPSPCGGLRRAGPAMLAIAVWRLAAGRPGDGEHRRYVQRGIRRAVWHRKVGGTLFPCTYSSCIAEISCAQAKKPSCLRRVRYLKREHVLAFQQHTNFQRNLQREAQFGVLQRAAQQFLNATQAIEQRIAVEVHYARGLAQVAVAAEEALQGFQQCLIATILSVEQRAERLLVKVEQRLFTKEGEEQAVNTQTRERVQFSLTKEAAANLQGLLCLAPCLRDSAEVAGDLSQAAGIERLVA